MTTNLENLADTIRNNAHGCAFVAGSLSESDVNATAQEWADNDFGAAQCGAWLDAGCFDAGSAAELRDAGLSPRDVKGNCPELPGYSWGYAFANSDVSLKDVLAACK